MDFTKLHIDLGVPIPERKIRKTLIGEFVQRMKVGDSVWCEKHKDAMALWQAIVREHGGKGSSLIRADVHKEFGKGWRVWRVK